MLTDKELEEKAEEYSHKIWCVDEICGLEEEEANSLKDCQKDFKAGYKLAKAEIEKLNEQVNVAHEAMKECEGIIMRQYGTIKEVYTDKTKTPSHNMTLIILEALQKLQEMKEAK